MAERTPHSGGEWFSTDTFFSDQYALDHTHVPPDPADIPEVIGWSAPGRSGTTALLFLLASQQNVDRAYFQPQKTLSRRGEPDYRLYPQDKVVCTKEVFGMLRPEENYDPIGHLLAAGVPPAKITWITVLRNPEHAYASWRKLAPPTTPEHFAAAQSHALNLYQKYKGTVRSVPFAYDLLRHGIHRTLEAVLAHTALRGQSINLSFDTARIAERVELGQARDPVYYSQAIAGTIGRGAFSYAESPAQLPEASRLLIAQKCGKDYEDFYEHSRTFLGM